MAKNKLNFTDLRIGNLIEDQLGNLAHVLSIMPILGIYQVRTEDIATKSKLDSSIRDVFGVRLTPELLMKIGFKPSDFFAGTVEDNVFRMGQYLISLGGWFLKVSGEGQALILATEVNFVHDLQNIYYNLEKIEITFK